MKSVIVTDIERPRAELVEQLEQLGVATVHEAMGRTGLVGTIVAPLQQGKCIAGSAVTVLCWPGDNLMIHAAVEQCRAGDVLVVTTPTPSLAGSFGELFATALAYRGVRGLVTTGGVRDVRELREMGFSVWAAAQNAQGTVKNTAGSVNVPVVVGEVVIRPGDIVIADDDGVLCLAPEDAEAVLEASYARVAKESEARAAYLEGKLSLDHNHLRPKLEELGVSYVPQAELDRA
ncbi:4-carboxy-4-hydroxy-2-oxoadipate aldolase/oxaloacetate decarboxylase [Leucobacter sp. UCMA 4100]|uniref:4-carboxy-4-hydroxy-2-oxoadipate aldolase/oxaloacetate decarboxylase n=1 Tax=Leucobacter sp. UCMA 4100 TaxID=2810534 RepID=UPI0022EB433D|nr:4-carboxy-4-hydroxy-2-oxoadipate aldolase/oxaloacetate decarboxylase [Leucobacter sp. UCMA 4100]MDA3146622.1 4-carboxy-4-hydroxy-2-oxoadipate aldolase/oxaloacetate decarboxylase [Leucobacter sp. UCMA 4100]